MDPLMFKVLWDHAASTTPTAPRTRARRTPVRHRLAHALRHMADTIEPAPRVATPAGC
jgi:hypothetical protein